MVFTRLALGFSGGVLFSMNCHHNVYLTISTLLVRPHMRYKHFKDTHMTKDHGINTTLVEHYFKDVFTSMVLFTAMIVPVLYKTHIKKINVFEE